ncbi:MAG: nuclear transport factor 2 family protein [Pseudomonadota bacterium]
MTPQEMAIALLTAVFVDHDPEAAAGLIAPDYIQHNASIPTGAEGLIGVIPLVESSGLSVTTHRILVEGNYVVLHNTWENAELFGAPTLVSFDVLRIEDGLFAEHWDNLQVPPAETASGRSMTDGPTEITDLHLTEQNRAIVTGFVTDVFLNGEFDRAADYINGAPGAYLQHNPLVPDGLDAVGAAFAQLAEAGQGISFSDLHLVVAEGNFVFTMTEGAMGETPTAFFDLWRVEDGMIVEHWDVIEPIATEWAHENGKF